MGCRSGRRYGEGARAWIRRRQWCGRHRCSWSAPAEPDLSSSTHPCFWSSRGRDGPMVLTAAGHKSSVWVGKRRLRLEFIGMGAWTAGVRCVARRAASERGWLTLEGRW
jgi:hypothetical protein